VVPRISRIFILKDRLGVESLEIKRTVAYRDTLNAGLKACCVNTPYSRFLSLPARNGP